MRKTLLFLAFCTLSAIAQAQFAPSRKNLINEKRAEFFKTDEARRIGEQVLLWQRNTGGWPKNIDMVTEMTAEQRQQVIADKVRRNDSTTDNGATTTQMAFIARLYQATGDNRYRDAFRKAVDYLLSGQYENGGWPQFWPVQRDYQIHITYNDDAMVNTMLMLRNVYEENEPYGNGLCDERQRAAMKKAFDKGVECILATQIRTNGVLTVWCQQHDHVTLQPAYARAYELPSYCAQESSGIIALLMSLPNPDERVKTAVHSAMAWIDKYKLTGIRMVTAKDDATGTFDRKIIHDANATPTWARFYDLKNNVPFVCDRDGVPRLRLSEIGYERRNGYAWYGNRPATLYPQYEKWAAKYDPEHKVAISLQTKGANENGTIEYAE